MDRLGMLAAVLTVPLAICAICAEGAQLASLAFTGQPVVQGTCSQFQPQQPLHLGQLTLPLAGLPADVCATLILPASVVEQEPSCQLDDSVLSVEFWALAWDDESPARTPDVSSMQVVDGAYLLVATGARPQAATTLNGKLVTFASGEGSTASSQPVQLDSHAVSDRRSYHMVQVPLQQGATRLPADLYVTVANLNPQLRLLSHYAVRAHCQPASQPLCPSASPLWGQCSSQLGLSATGRQVLLREAAKQGEKLSPSGQCRWMPASDDSSQASAYCECAEGLGGYACASLVNNVTALVTAQQANTSSSGSNTSSSTSGVVSARVASSGSSLDVTYEFVVPPRTWAYFWAQVPAAGTDPTLLVELWQPPGSGAFLDPILGITAARAKGMSVPAPGLSSITFGDPEEYVDVQQSYVASSIRPSPHSAPMPEAVWVSVFNNALPWDAVNSTASNSVLKLRLRAVAGPDQDMVCPESCSGAGTCMRPTMLDEGSATYQCQCNAGFGGPWCQGPLRVRFLDLGNPKAPPRSYDMESLKPGEWHFYQLNFGPGIVAALSQQGPRGALMVSYEVEEHGAGAPDSDDVQAGEGYATKVQSGPRQPWDRLGADNHGASAGFDWGRRKLQDGDPADTSSSSSHMFMMLTPYDADTSFGDDFFSATMTKAATRSAMYKLTLNELRQGPSIMVAVFNSDLMATAPTSYSLCSVWVPAPGAGGGSHVGPDSLAWYTVFVAVSAGSVLLVLIMVVASRLCVWRLRLWRATLLGQPLTQAEAQAMADLAARQPKGLPQHVMAAFPLLQYSAPDQLVQFITSASDTTKAQARPTDAGAPPSSQPAAGKATSAPAGTAAALLPPTASLPPAGPSAITTQVTLSVTASTQPQEAGAGQGPHSGPLLLAPAPGPRPLATTSMGHAAATGMSTGAANSSRSPPGTSNSSSSSSSSSVMVLRSVRTGGSSHQLQARHADPEIGIADEEEEGGRKGYLPGSSSRGAAALQGGQAVMEARMPTSSGGYAEQQEPQQAQAHSWDVVVEVTGALPGKGPEGGGGAVPPPEQRQQQEQQPASPGALGKWYQEGLQDSAPSCSVCLCEFEPGDMLRVLLPCAHAFHQGCIDPWLGGHDTCPMCRTNLLEAALAAGLVPRHPPRSRTSLASRFRLIRRGSRGTASAGGADVARGWGGVTQLSEAIAATGSVQATPAAPAAAPQLPGAAVSAGSSRRAGAGGTPRAMASPAPLLTRSSQGHAPLHAGSPAASNAQPGVGGGPVSSGTRHLSWAALSMAQEHGSRQGTPARRSLLSASTAALVASPQCDDRDETLTVVNPLGDLASAQHSFASCNSNSSSSHAASQEPHTPTPRVPAAATVLGGGAWGPSSGPGSSPASQGGGAEHLVRRGIGRGSSPRT